MKIKRTVISLLCMVVFLVSSNVYALSPDQNGATTIQESYFLDKGHGEFMIDVNSTSEQKPNSEDKKVKAKKLDSDIYEIVDKAALVENKEYNKLIKVNENTLLRVKELKIDLLNSKQIEKYIDEYSINPEMAKDIRNRAILAQEKDSIVDNELTIYTPHFAKEANTALTTGTGINLASLGPITGINIASLAKQSTYYYVGYNNQKYMDEIWFGKSSPTYYTIRTGYTVKDYFDDTLNNFCNFAIGGIGDTLSSGAYSILQIFASKPVISYPANSGDVWQAGLNESKWRKYTSIEMWDDITGRYQYYVRAVSDRANTYFQHYLYRAYNGARDYADDPTNAYIGRNYYSLDAKAYLYMYDLPYTEYLGSYSVNKWTSFTSQ